MSHIVVSDTSAPTYWRGDAVKSAGTRKYYRQCEYEGEIYDIHDCVLLNCNDRPFYVARIMEMWEQAKKKWLTVLWFWRASDVLNELALNNSLSKEEKQTVEKYLKSSHPQELFQSSQMDSNYPSTLVCKCNVRFFDEIKDLNGYIKENKEANFYYKKHWDSLTKTFANGTSFIPPKYPECITYIPGQRKKGWKKRNVKIKDNNLVTPRKKRVRTEILPGSGPQDSNKKRRPDETLNNNDVKQYPTRNRLNPTIENIIIQPYSPTLIDPSRNLGEENSILNHHLRETLDKINTLMKSGLECLEEELLTIQNQTTEKLEKLTEAWTDCK